MTKTSALVRATISSFVGVLFATSAGAGGAIKGNIVPIIDTCYQGSCNVGSESCATNADCHFQWLSPKSRIALRADGRLKVQLREVVDETGADANGEHILFVVITGPQYKAMILKIPVLQGAGEVDVNLGTFLGDAGEAVALLFVSLDTPPTVPDDCSYRGNTAYEIEMRGLDPDCFSGRQIATMGLVSGGKSRITAFLPPNVDVCEAGLCSSNLPCTTNSDCNFGWLSPRSKVSLTGEGRLKVQLKNVIDSAGNPASGDYQYDIGIDYVPHFVEHQEEHLLAKIVVVDGEGQIDVDLSPTLTFPGHSLVLNHDGVYGPPTNPEDCPGDGNTIAEMEARVSTEGCFGGHRIGQMGVAAVARWPYRVPRQDSAAEGAGR